jgi:ATP-dependent Clp protease adaptor protein ClpS
MQTVPRGEVAAPGRTASVPETEERQQTGAAALEPHKVILYNDDVNTMDHVVRSLLRSVPGLSTSKAVDIMMEAHNTGRAIVIVCPLELAELVRDRLESCGLTATIER